MYLRSFDLIINERTNTIMIVSVDFMYINFIFNLTLLIPAIQDLHKKRVQRLMWILPISFSLQYKLISILNTMLASSHSIYSNIKTFSSLSTFSPANYLLQLLTPTVLVIYLIHYLFKNLKIGRADFFATLSLMLFWNYFYASIILLIASVLLVIFAIFYQVINKLLSTYHSLHNRTRNKKQIRYGLGHNLYIKMPIVTPTHSISLKLQLPFIPFILFASTLFSIYIHLA